MNWSQFERIMLCCHSPPTTRKLSVFFLCGTWTLQSFRRVQTKIVIELLFIILLNENAVTFNCYLQILVCPRKCDKIQCFFYRLSAKALQESWMTISLTEDLSGSLVPCYYYWPERYTSLDLKCLLFCFDDGDECFTWLDGGKDIFVCHCDPPFNY